MNDPSLLLETEVIIAESFKLKIATVAPGTDCTHLALTLGVLTRSHYEVWFNGQRLPSSESLDPADARIPRPITHLIPPCTTPYPRSLLIALHFASLDMNPDWRLPDQGP